MYMIVVCKLMAALFHENSVLLLKPILAMWTKWTSWPECEVNCGGGHSTRKRKCELASTEIDEQQCSGLSSESRECGTAKCRK